MEIELKIEKLGAHGDGVGVFAGKEVYAAFTVPGERVRGVVEGDRMVKPSILEPVPERIKAPCTHFKTCGGCSTQHIRPDFLAAWKQGLVRDNLQKVGLDPKFRETVTSPHQSRRRAVFSGKRTKNGTMIGFHGRGTHTIIPITSCQLIAPEISAGFAGLNALTMLAASRKSVVRISATTSDGGLDVEIADALPRDADITQKISEVAHEHNLARVIWNGDVVLERKPAQQRFGQALVVPPSGSFLQATKEGEAALVKAVHEIVLPAKQIVDLFSGCGTFALALADKAEIVAVESSAEMLQALDKGWRRSKGLKKVETQKRDLFRNPFLPDELNKYDAIVLDPPRAGAAAQVEQLARSKVSKIAFVSCNPATFARDAKTLCDAGFTLDWVQVVDQFLWSGHCELVAQFTQA